MERVSGGSPVLEIRDVHRAFRGLRAVAGCSFELDHGSVTGLIGPNGSGKTTMLNLVSGQLRPDRGMVVYRGRDITRLGPDQRSRLGIGRTFQLVRIFHDLSVLENMLAVSRKRSLAEATRNALEILDRVKLTALRDAPGDHLSYGQRKLLEFARVVSLEPDLFLLDEPFAGINRVLAADLADLIESLRALGKTILIIDHEMKIITKICDRLVVMDHGEILTEGSTATVQADPRVLDAYFGKEITTHGA